MVINHASHRTATRLSLDRELAAVVIPASRSRRPLLAGAARSSIDECSAVARARHHLTQTSACRNACEAPSPCTPVHREFQTHARNVRFGPPPRQQFIRGGAPNSFRDHVVFCIPRTPTIWVNDTDLQRCRSIHWRWRSDPERSLLAVEKWQAKPTR